MKVVVVTSGGMDSAVLLAQHVRHGDSVRAISIDYGQRHVRELQYAREFAKLYNVVHTVVDLRSLAAVLPGSSQTSGGVEVPHGHYAEESMKKTVVPNRNMILLSIAIGHAVAYECDFVSYAAHAGDHAIYPDCRPIFVDALNVAAQLADWRVVRIARPFIDLTKEGIVRVGQRYNVNFKLTYSCYEGKEKHCGKCGTCTERIEAFKLAGLADPTEYATS